MRPPDEGGTRTGSVVRNGGSRHVFGLFGLAATLGPVNACILYAIYVRTRRHPPSLEMSVDLRPIPSSVVCYMIFYQGDKE